MATYVLLSTSNAAYGWTAYCEGSKKECEKALETYPDFNGTDIWADTHRKNAVIVSKTTAIRKYNYDPEYLHT